MKKKIVSFVSLAIAASGLAAGCAVDAQDGVDSELIGEGVEAAVECNNSSGTHAMLAMLAQAVGEELHRWQVPSDFEIHQPWGKPQMLRIKQSSRGMCTNGCKTIDALLSFQDPKMDQQFIFPGGKKLSSWQFGTDLIKGFNDQKTCDSRGLTDLNGCPAELHYLTLAEKFVSPFCNHADVSRYTATTGDWYGNNLGGALKYPKHLCNKLIWAEQVTTPLQTAGNKYINCDVNVGAEVKVDVDPGWYLSGPGASQPGVCEAACNWLNPAAGELGTCCSCNGLTTTWKASPLSSSVLVCKL